MQCVSEADLLPPVVCRPQGSNDFVGFFAPVSDEVELVLAGLTRVPELVEIGIDSHSPPQDDRVEVSGIDEILEKYRPFEYLRVALDTDARPCILRDAQNGLAQRIAVVGDQVELEALAVLLEPSFGAAPVSRFVEQRERGGRVVGQG